MCYDMRRFEKMAEELKHVKRAHTIEFIINEPGASSVTVEAEHKELKNRKHS
jgi:hypothetical protein